MHKNNVGMFPDTARKQWERPVHSEESVHFARLRNQFIKFDFVLALVFGIDHVQQGISSAPPMKFVESMEQASSSVAQLVSATQVIIDHSQDSEIIIR